MNKIFLFFFSFLIQLPGFGQKNTTSIAIIPEPVSMVKTKGVFYMPKNILIEASSKPELKEILVILKDRFSIPTGLPVTVKKFAPTATIRLILNKTKDITLGEEGYRLIISPKQIKILANQASGLFYGVQSLIQLFPKEIERDTFVKNIKWQVPCVQITDYPRFVWRGLMLDVAFHFFTKEDVKRFIDDMVKYKFNLLHLHLADDEGWRIEIKGLPNLTQAGAFNVKKLGYLGTRITSGELLTYGGFYTQEDIKELVKYANERFVNILPEIDVPGHSLAAVVSYPELSCTPGADKYNLRVDEDFMDWSSGKPIAIVDNTLCPANENVYNFLDKVITELAQLFPFEYIHLGGDECPKNTWEKSDAVKALMQKEGLKNMEEVQNYFEKRLEKIVISKGKKFMGWEEVLDGGGLSPSSAVMGWKGMNGGNPGAEAFKMKHSVVMCPTTFAYFDYMQGDSAIEPIIYDKLRLNKVYQFEPVPDGVDASYIKGGQANLWTEKVFNIRHVEYMTYPRALALSESLWSPKAKKNWNYFSQKVEKHFSRLDEANIKYCPAVYDPIVNLNKSADGQLKIKLSTEIDGLDIYYAFDESFPDRYYPKYTEVLIPPKDATTLKVITYKGDKPVGRMITFVLKELKERVEKKEKNN